MSSDGTNREVTWDYCATWSEATELASAAQRVTGMEVRMRSIGQDALGPHIACAAARALEGAGSMATYLVSVSYDAHAQAAGSVSHMLESVVRGCGLHR